MQLAADSRQASWQNEDLNMLLPDPILSNQDMILALLAPSVAGLPPQKPKLYMLYTFEFTNNPGHGKGNASIFNHSHWPPESGPII